LLDRGYKKVFIRYKIVLEEFIMNTYASDWYKNVPSIIGDKMDDLPKTITVPEAGEKYFGLSRNGSYAAAERGDIPTIRIGRLLRVPTAKMEAMLRGG
jgi:hypothetical protein